MIFFLGFQSPEVRKKKREKGLKISECIYIYIWFFFV
jgi:hypothetical protein